MDLIGTAGSNGTAGATGEQGVQGEQGEQGAQGEQGEQGEQGDTGLSASQEAARAAAAQAIIDLRILRAAELSALATGDVTIEIKWESGAHTIIFRKPNTAITDYFHLGTASEERYRSFYNDVIAWLG